jgi:8-oxo-dGTP pyrophosphatase MutT (NUDIX family)
MPHIHTAPGQVDHTVEVFVVNGDRVLLRKHDKFGIWLSVGGHIELYEDPTEAALREVREEVGLDVELVGARKPRDFDEPGYVELVPPVFVNRVKITEDHDHVTYTYFARWLGGDIQTEGPNDEVRWFTLEELTANEVAIKQSIRHYARSALEALASSNEAAV